MAEVVSHPDLCQSFTVSRSSGSFVQGGWQETRTEFPAYGIVTVAGDRTLRMFPEADRIEGSQSFFATIPLFVSHPTKVPGTSDIFTWRGEKYGIKGWYNFYMDLPAPTAAPYRKTNGERKP